MVKAKPLVSVCCITYNHENFIRDTIEGFLIQKTTFPFEIIIHDDASTDGTTEIVKEYAEKHPELFVTIFQKENQYSNGVKPFINFVLPKAKGKYIALCEGDDYWTDPLKLQKQVEFLEENEEYAICAHETSVVVNNKTIFFSELDMNAFKGNYKQEYTTEDIIKGIIFHTSSVLYRNINIDLATYFNRIINGDLALFMLLSKYGRTMVLKDCMSVYRKHTTSITSSDSNFTNEIIRLQYRINLYNTINEYYNFNYNDAIKPIIDGYLDQIKIKSAQYLTMIELIKAENNSIVKGKKSFLFYVKLCVKALFRRIGLYNK